MQRRQRREKEANNRQMTKFNGIQNPFNRNNIICQSFPNYNSSSMYNIGQRSTKTRKKDKKYQNRTVFHLYRTHSESGWTKFLVIVLHIFDGYFCTIFQMDLVCDNRKCRKDLAAWHETHDAECVRTHWICVQMYFVSISFSPPPPLPLPCVSMCAWAYVRREHVCVCVPVQW